MTIQVLSGWSSDDAEPVGKLYRNSTGRVVHKAGCRILAGNHTPWNWAEGRPLLEVVNTCLEVGVKPCRLCRPLDGRP